MIKHMIISQDACSSEETFKKLFDKQFSASVTLIQIVDCNDAAFNSFVTQLNSYCKWYASYAAPAGEAYFDPYVSHDQHHVVLVDLRYWKQIEQEHSSPSDAAGNFAIYRLHGKSENNTIAVAVMTQTSSEANEDHVRKFMRESAELMLDTEVCMCGSWLTSSRKMYEGVFAELNMEVLTNVFEDEDNASETEHGKQDDGLGETKISRHVVRDMSPPLTWKNYKTWPQFIFCPVRSSTKRHVKTWHRVLTSKPLPPDLWQEFGKYVMHVGNVPDFTIPIAKKEEVQSEDDEDSSHRRDISTKRSYNFPLVSIDQRMHDFERRHIKKALQMICFVRPHKQGKPSKR